MFTTYYIEDCNGNIVNYWNRLQDAKDYFLFMSSGNAENEYVARNDLRIVQLKGSYKYEGKHVYYLTYDGMKWIKEKN